MAPIETITITIGRLRTTLEDIPGGIECVVCGKPTVKAFVPYQFEGDVVVRVLQTPGYRCTSPTCAEDPPEYVSDEALLEIFTVARDEMLERGLTLEAEKFKRRIEFQKRAQEESRRLEGDN
ncbi:MAG: hypothetical protein US96_C0031G0008 [Candidatus Woesebacteria bacterium GW2011_GWB1_38_5b]|uniref:Uncharacterized protein n=1 Tax=Candidatus Woesebacteria bacterium GW2011_GWB1_38_5b TaxID=1618569 RepID=A0A0G0K406_9BACT|nr:MAG: hypothetical protein US96_C0031G0008 [Candidatus Woesebacteria bacterium GW2011_GWB1_38_5b]